MLPKALWKVTPSQSDPVATVDEMKILGVVFVGLILVLQYRIWWGEASVDQINLLRQEIAEQKHQNSLLKQQNELLRDEIQALRNNPETLEERAREQLGLIKPGETFYRVIPAQD